MNGIKISLITISRNAATTIQRCMDSIFMQAYHNLEYIVIDGNSDDGTWETILKNKADIHFFKSESDLGIYDAINKGIIHATGDVVGVLNADDYFVDEEVLSAVAGCFEDKDTDVVYADLDYVGHNDQVVRRWRAGNYERNHFNYGWMPPHPTFYVRRRLFDTFGLYRGDYGSAADYELMLRFMYLNKTKVSYLNKVIVKMKTGGISNRYLGNRLLAWQSDYKAMKMNHINIPLLAVMLKPLRKIAQFFC
ncbi:glycosyltransferase family 2 protein [Pedobacter nyackensis]|uniref:glycosyltransferase family 2 protein n=1 Tax=Pedobacter nyackensis TaxID=475255 RepID=UPI00292EDA39|nr:glycosyltransferase family 2 protein [Pedobacter nyackensis]